MAEQNPQSTELQEISQMLRVLCSCHTHSTFSLVKEASQKQQDVENALGKAIEHRIQLEKKKLIEELKTLEYNTSVNKLWFFQRQTPAETDKKAFIHTKLATITEYLQKGEITNAKEELSHFKEEYLIRFENNNPQEKQSDFYKKIELLFDEMKIFDNLDQKKPIISEEIQATPLKR